jgi:hypothetical protein
MYLLKLPMKTEITDPRIYWSEASMPNQIDIPSINSLFDDELACAA